MVREAGPEQGDQCQPVCQALRSARYRPKWLRHAAKDGSRMQRTPTVVRVCRVCHQTVRECRSNGRVQRHPGTSPRATVEPVALRADDSIDDGFGPRLRLEDINHFVGRPTKIDKWPYPPVPQFIPIIGTDWNLAHAIKEELDLRHAWPDQKKKTECIVLVTEKDTLYGEVYLGVLLRFPLRGFT